MQERVRQLNKSMKWYILKFVNIISLYISEYNENPLFQLKKKFNSKGLFVF